MPKVILNYREDDVDEIAKEAGIDIKKSEEIEEHVQITKKDKKKKKAKPTER